jgi:serine O-acetyltransferase
MSNLKLILWEDLSWINFENGFPQTTSLSWIKILYHAVKRLNFRILFIFRLAQCLHQKHFSLLSSILSRHLRKKYCVEISLEAQVSGGLRMPHPIGIVIGSGSVIDRFVTIGQHVTVGANFTKVDCEGRRYPRIGCYAWISAGAVIAGPVNIGSRAVIGANSVVTQSVPEDAVAAGIPAEVIRVKQEQIIGLEN